MGNVGDVVTSSGRPFHVWAAATLNVLPILDSLNDGTTWRSVLAERRQRRRGKSDERSEVTRFSPIKNFMRQHSDLKLDALRDA